MSHVPKFNEQVKTIVRSIPSGQTMTYGAVAKAAGRPGAARAVASVMAKNYDPTVPCHRVIRSDGSLGDYNRGGTDEKRRLLTTEGAI